LNGFVVNSSLFQPHDLFCSEGINGYRKNLKANKNDEKTKAILDHRTYFINFSRNGILLGKPVIALGSACLRYAVGRRFGTRAWFLKSIPAYAPGRR
jgi:hypothetical protein